MNFISLKPLLLLGIATLALAGCAGDPVKLNSLQTKDIVQGSERTISGEACGFQLLLFIPIMTNSRLERAMEQLQLKAGGDSIANVSIQESWWYGLVGTTYCTNLQAKAYKKSSGK